MAAPFTAYPRILHLLMDKGRAGQGGGGPAGHVGERAGLAAIEAGVSLSEMAIMTRAAPARLLGPGGPRPSRAGPGPTLPCIDDLADRTAMFRRRAHVSRTA